MSQFPPIKWTPLTIRNPDRRWWQFWKPRWVWNPGNPIGDLFAEHDRILEDLVWKETSND